MVLEFAVPGKAKPKERARSGRGHFYTPEKTRRYEALVATCARIAMRDRHIDGPDEGPVAVELILYFARTKGVPPDESFPVSIRRADFDNATKAIIDAMQGLVYKNDKQIVDAHVCLRYCPRSQPAMKPQVLVRVWTAGQRRNYSDMRQGGRTP